MFPKLFFPHGTLSGRRKSQQRTFKDIFRHLVRSQVGLLKIGYVKCYNYCRSCKCIYCLGGGGGARHYPWALCFCDLRKLLLLFCLSARFVFPPDTMSREDMNLCPHRCVSEKKMCGQVQCSPDPNIKTLKIILLLT